MKGSLARLFSPSGWFLLLRLTTPFELRNFSRSSKYACTSLNSPSPRRTNLIQRDSKQRKSVHRYEKKSKRYYKELLNKWVKLDPKRGETTKAGERGDVHPSFLVEGHAASARRAPIPSAKSLSIHQLRSRKAKKGTHVRSRGIAPPVAVVVVGLAALRANDQLAFDMERRKTYAVEAVLGTLVVVALVVVVATRDGAVDAVEGTLVVVPAEVVAAVVVIAEVVAAVVVIAEVVAAVEDVLAAVVPAVLAPPTGLLCPRLRGHQPCPTA